MKDLRNKLEAAAILAIFPAMVMVAQVLELCHHC